MPNEKPIESREFVNQALREARSHLVRADCELTYSERPVRERHEIAENELRACADACRKAADAVAAMALAELKQPS